MQTLLPKILLSLFLILPYSSLKVIKEIKHPLHVSTTEINYNAKESVETSCKIFTDDFEDVLAKQYKVKTDLNKPSMQKEMDVVITKYLSNHLQYKVNGKTMEAAYLGFEKDNEATNVYLEIKNVSSFQKLNLTNSILYDLFNDQMNILHVTKSGLRKSVRANYPETVLNVSL